MFNNPEFVTKLLGWSNNLYIFAVVVTVLATFGVVYFGKLATQLKDDQLQQYQSDANARIAESNRLAAEAAQGSAGANATAESAKAQAEAAKKDAALANAEAEKSKTERAALQLRIQELTRSNEEQQKQIRVLKENETPRTISPQQKAAIVAALATHKGETIQVQIFSQETEALSFSNQVNEAFTSAGLKVSSVVMMGGIGTGLGFSLHAESDQPQLAIAIANVFHSLGIPFGVQIRPAETPEHTFVLFIGSKPKFTN
jgi:hypothetical protein